MIDAYFIGKKSEPKLLKRMTFIQFKSIVKICQELSSLWQAPEVTPEADDECAICLERSPDVVLSCMVVPNQHAFCQTCIDSWQVRDESCPFCREAFQSEDNFVILGYSQEETVVAIQQNIQELFGLLDLR